MPLAFDLARDFLQDIAPGLLFVFDFFELRLLLGLHGGQRFTLLFGFFFEIV